MLGALLLVAYGCYAMHSTIVLEAFAGAFLLVVIASRRYG